jgi:hypothetical protein
MPLSNYSLFGDDELEKVTITKPLEENVETKILPLILLPKKRASKSDSALEKEMRKYNRLLKELHEYEEAEKEQQKQEELYSRLCIEKILPVKQDLAEVQILFIKQIENIFYANKPTRALEKTFIEVLLTILQDAATVNIDAREISKTYLDKQISLLSKADKKQLAKAFERNGYTGPKEGFTNFDAEAFMNNQTENFDFENFAKNAHEKSAAEAAAKKDSPISVTELYKELIKLLHPDLEQNETVKIEKEQLMKELTLAKENNNLHDMLVIKQKAYEINKAEIKFDSYSLDTLKAYNKILKQKIDQLIPKYRNGFFNGLSIRNGIIHALPEALPAELRVKQDIKELKEIKKTIMHNRKAIQNYTAVVEFIKAFELMLQAEDDIDFWDDYDDF